MTIVMNNEPYATERQLSYLDDLVEKRAVPQYMADDYTAKRSVLRKKQASTLIDVMLKFPIRKTDVRDMPSEKMSERQKLLAELLNEMETFPQAKYAIPAEELMMDLLKKPIRNDHVFCELKEYRGKLHFRQLHGAPGSFSRSTFPVEDSLVFARIIKRDPYKYTRIFADIYQCCGKCGADLTDEISRSLRLGPICRKGFGV